MRCGVVVEVAGRRLGNASKDMGLQVVVPVGKGATFVRVLGFKREVRFCPRDVRQLITTRLAEGQLVIVGQDGTRVQVTKANPELLEPVVSCLQGKAATASTAAGAAAAGHAPNAGQGSTKRSGSDVVGAGDGRPSKKASGGATATPSRPQSSSEPSTPVLKQAKGEAALSLTRFPEFLLDMMVEMASLFSFRQFSQSCRMFHELIMLRRSATFRLGESRGSSISAEMVVQHLAKRSFLRSLDLTGFSDLTAAVSGRLAETLGKLRGRSPSGEGLLTLSLRSCKGLTDVAVRRILIQCPCLESLDLLDIPRLSNQVFSKAPLPRLQMLAAGSLARPGVGDRTRQAEASQGAACFQQSVSALGTAAAPAVQSFAGSSRFTASLISCLHGSSSTAGGVSGSSDGSSMTAAADTDELRLSSLVLPRCGDIEAFPLLPPPLQHLDLSFANLELPRTLIGWQPLAGCPNLKRLALAGNRCLSSMALQACLDSLPKEARLEALDLSSTASDGALFARLIKWPMTSKLTHLRLACCIEMRNKGIAGLLLGLAELQMLDVAGCRSLESPLTGIAPPRALYGTAVPQGSALRRMGVGQTDLAGPSLEATRRIMQKLAPDVEVVPSSLDFFGGYTSLFPELA